MKKLLLLVSCLLLLVSCSDNIVIENNQLDCDWIHQKYSQLILDEAISNGYVIGEPLNINTTDIFLPGFFEITYDDNIRIFIEVIQLYSYQYNKELEQSNCK